jgi:hypothetical protein
MLDICLGFEPESVYGTRLDIYNLGKLVLTSMCYRHKDVLTTPSFQMSMICRGGYLDVRQYGLIVLSEELTRYVCAPLVEDRQANK